MLPIESSLIGPIAETHDLLYGSALSIVREATLPIRHCVLGVAGARLETATTVLVASRRVRPVPRPARRHATSVHPGGDDRRRGPDGRRSGRSRPARDRERRGRRARTGSRCSPTTSATSPARSRASSRSRRTRSSAGGEGWRTALSFVTDHQPGALFRALGPLARNGVNLVQLVSRPLPNSPWRYRFDVVLDGHVFDPSVRPALAELRAADARAAALRLVRGGGRAVSGSTLFRKIWDAHVVEEHDGAPALLYVDLHLVHEVTSPQAFEALRAAGRPVRRPDLTVATMDHNVPTLDGPITDPLARAQLDALRANCEEFGVPLFATGSGREGIVHVIGPELGVTQPGMTIVCGDSHTSTHGAFGALAFGIGTSEVEHVLATQTLPQALPEDDAGRVRRRAAVRALGEGHGARRDRPARRRGRPGPRARVHRARRSRRSRWRAA